MDRDHAALDRWIADRAIVRIARDEIDANPLQAIPLRRSESLLLVQEVDDLLLDGLHIVRHEDITSIDRGDTERFQRTMLADQGLLDDLAVDPGFDLVSMAALLRSIPSGTIVIIESETDEDDEFWIGRLVGVDEDDAFVHEFDGVAEWSEDLSEVPIDTITHVVIGSRYARVYAAYFERNPPPEVPGGEGHAGT